MPDLTVSDITLDDQGRVIVTLSNVGKGYFPPQAGEIRVYVGDELKWNAPLSAVPDKAFLGPGGVSLYATPVELEGSFRVMVVVDGERSVREGDESNNILTRRLSYRKPVLLRPEPPPLPEPEEPAETPSYPDLAITDLTLSSERQLVIHVANVGTKIFPLPQGSVRVSVDGVFKGNFPLGTPQERRELLPQEEMLVTTSVTIAGRHEVDADIQPDPGSNEKNRGNNALRKTLEGVPVGPDLVVRELTLNDDFDLSIILSNVGELELRKGTTLGIRIFVNGQKVSEFNHFISEPVRPYSGSDYAIDPPYRVRLSANSRVRVTIYPKQSRDDVKLSNNSLVRSFAFLPFRVEPQTSQEFSVDLSRPGAKESRREEKIKAEIRWDGGGAPLRLSLGKGFLPRKIPPVQGKSPLRIEVPIEGDELRKERVWRFSVGNLMEKTVEGYLIIQSP